jgi:tetratricopeptide (TPR) repeat protein
MPDSAASFRTRCCMAHADLAAAAESRRHFEVLSVRTGALANARIIELTSHLTTYALCDDAIGLRRTHRALQEAAKARPGWQPRVELAQVRLLQCRGARHEALRVVEALLARLVLPHADWQFAAATQLELLVAEKRSPEAVERGREYLARAHAAQLPDYHIAWTLARACLVQGAHDEAEQHYAHAIAQLEARGAQGILPGCAYEVGARIASARGDVAAFETRVEACASHFRPGKHPGLTARYNALRRDGSREGRWGKDGSASGVNSEATLSDSRLESLLQAAADSPDDATFYQGILQRLLDGAAAVGGVLYVNDAGRLVRVAMAGAVAARPELDAAVARSCALDEESVTATESKPPAQAPGLTTDSGAIEICVLDGREGGAPIVEGALVLEHATRDRPVRVHAWLKGVALAVATRSRARSVFGSGTQSLTALHQRPNTEHSNTEGNDPDTTSTTEPAAG